VRIAIRAPADVPVHRGEIYRRILQADERRATALAIASRLHETNKSLSRNPSGVPERSLSRGSGTADAEFIFV
jgi:hypothetical protein